MKIDPDPTDTPPASVQPPPTSEETRELFIARHFVALFLGLVALAFGLLAWFLGGWQ